MTHSNDYQPPMQPYLEVLHADSDILVINKPSGLLSVPGRKPSHQDCLVNRAQQQYPTATSVHRLDMETSGVIIMALNKPSHVHLCRQFENREVHKKYIARVFGHMPENTGTIEAPLICDWPNRPKQKVDFEIGKKATTHWRVLSKNENTSLLELTPITGRSHQLRVHLLYLGKPIIGDQLYACKQALDMSPRLQLHSQSIEFTHPSTLKTAHFFIQHSFD